MLLDSDRNRLRHMADAAGDAIEFSAGLTRSDLEDNRQLQFALIRCIEIMGEAAGRISKECRAANAEFPWTSIIGMRNRLIHAYFDIDLDIVWKTVTEELPGTFAQIQKILVSLDHS